MFISPLRSGYLRSSSTFRLFSQVKNAQSPIANQDTYKSPKMTTLDNGLKIVSFEGSSMTSTLSIGFPVGSRDETGENLGICSILKHMGFYNSDLSSQLTLYRRAEENGFLLKNHGDHEFMTYSLFNFRETWYDATTLLFEGLLNPRIENFQVSKLKETVCKAQTELLTDIRFQFSEALYASAYGAFSPIGRPFYISKDLMGSYQSINEFVRNKYTLNGAVLVGTGVSHDNLINGASHASTKPLTRERTVYKGGEFRVALKLPFVHFGIAFKGCDVQSSDWLKLEIFKEIVSNRLSNMDSTKAFNIKNSDAGLFGVYAKTSEENITNHINNVADSVKSCLEFSQSEFEFAKTRTFLTLGTSYQDDELLCNAVISGTFVHDLTSTMNSINSDQVRNIAKTTLSSPISVASLGNSYTFPSYDSIANKF